MKAGRRNFLAGAAIALGSAIALVRRSGYEVAAPLVSLSPGEYVVVQHLARRVCAADAPNVVTADAADVAGFVDRYVAEMPTKMAGDLRQFLSFIEQVAPLMLGMSSRFTRLAAADQDKVLASLEAHALDVLRGGFAGVKALLFMGFYRDPRTWSVLGYEGPLV